MRGINLIFGILMLLLCSCDNNSNAQNIALNKVYTLSKQPNYNLTSTDVNHSILTDGVYSSGLFWKSNNSVGWQSVQRISIDIPLKGISKIDKITFNTARGNTSGVEFPSHVFAFISTDNINYIYKGDIVADINNVSGAYEVRKFTLTGINQKAAYIKLVVIPNGYYSFCDEIEVIAGGNATSKISKTVAVNKIDTAVDSLLNANGASQKIVAQIKRMQSGLGKPGLSMSTTGSNVTGKLNQAKAKWLQNQQALFKKDIIVSKVNPWGGIVSPYSPPRVADNKYSLSIPVNGTQYGAFVITNLSNTNRLVSVSNSGISPICDIRLYTAPFITSGKNYDDIADPLLINNGAITLTPGESHMVVFKVSGKASGLTTAGIEIISQSFVSELSISINVLKLKFASPLSLNAVNWAYLTYPMLSDRKDEAVSDLIKHNINSMVVPPNVLPFIGNSDFSAYKTYISKLGAFKNLFIYINFPNKENVKGITFMSADWKSNFIKWYNGLIQTSKTAGFSQEQIYLYPYDEINEKDLGDFNQFLAWLKKDYPVIKTFATLSSINTFQKLMPLLTLSMVTNEKGLIDGAKDSNKDIWMYDTKSGAEALSPYSYYRLMAWRAFFNNMDGIGFWNYADYRNGSDNKLFLEKFNGVNSTNYSVIYDGPGTSIISSRRWEAFSLGIEDYELLKIYASRNGYDKAKALVATVLNNPNDYSKADAVRNQILLSIKN
jgi:hypothetical protein